MPRFSVIRLIACAALLPLVGMGCAKPSPATAPVASAAPIAEDVHLEREQQVGKGSCKATIAYPQFTGTGDAVVQANAAIETSVVGLLAEAFDKPAMRTPALEAEAFVASCADGLRGIPGESDQPREWSSVIDGKVLFQDDRVASVMLRDVSYLGSAHPNTTRTFLTFERATGRTLSLSDFVEPGSEIRVVTAEYASLVGTSGGGLFEDDKKRMEDFLLNPDLTAAKIELASRAFSVDERGVVLRHSLYEIAPYVAGFLDVPLTYDQLGSALRRP